MTDSSADPSPGSADPASAGERGPALPTPLPPPTVEGARHGHVEPTEFETFCAREHARLARALSLALDNRELGRDAAAEALTRAFERWDEVRLHANLTGWAYRVGLNWGRSRLRRRRREVSVVLVPERPRPAPEIDDGVARALARLSTDHRAVVVGRYYLDWSEADVAAALDIPPGTVKSRLSRALAQLEQHLEHDDA